MHLGLVPLTYTPRSVSRVRCQVHLEKRGRDDENGEGRMDSEAVLVRDQTPEVYVPGHPYVRDDDESVACG